MPRCFMSCRSGLLAWVLLLAVLCATPALAQEKTAASLLESKPQAPAAIAVADIPTRADTDERYAEEVTLRAKDEDPFAQLTPQLDDITRSVNEKAKLFQYRELIELPVLRLESLERNWAFDARRFARWQADMRQASEPFAQAAAELAKRRADWEATQKSTLADSIATALSDRVAAVIAKLQQAEQALSPPLQAQIALGRRANALEARIEASQKSVDSAIRHIDSRLLHTDSTPLWAVNKRTGAAESTVESVRTGMQIELRFLQEYSGADLGNQRLLHVLQALLLPLLIWLRLRTNKTVPSSADEEASIRVLRRPLSTWLLLSMMGVLVFEPDAPLVLHQIAMLVALVPVLRLLPPHSFRLLGPWPYVATGLYLLERVSFLFVANSVAYRSYSLALSALTMGMMLWLLLHSRHKHSLRLAGRTGKAMHALAWASVVLMAVSIVANVVGNVSLAEMLTAGVIDSGYAGLLLYAGITVFTALLQLLSERRSLARLNITPEHAAPLLRGLTRLLFVGAVIGWCIFTLNRFRVFRPVYAAAESMLTHAFKFGELSVSLGDVLVFAIAVVIAYWAAGSVRYLLRDQLLPKMSLPRGVGNSVASLTYYAMLLLGLLVALSAAGFKVSQLAFVFGALGVGIGFGLQNVVNNFVSGLILMFERPIQPGDIVDITGTSGTVREIGMRATTIKTFDGADVVVPNGTLLSEKLTNWTLLDMNRRLDIELGVAYGSDPVQVVALLKQVVAGTPNVAHYPEPTVLFLRLGTSSLDFSVRAWTHDFNNWASVRSDLMTRIHAALNEAGIEIPFPQQDMHLRSVSKDAATMLAARMRLAEDGGEP